MIIKRLLLFIGMVIHSVVTPKEVIFIIHGTWAHKKPDHWYNPTGYFFDTLEQQLKKDDSVIVSFLWSGSNTPQARESAANVLAKAIESYTPDTNIIIIGHSHGATVGVLASQKLGQNKHNKHSITQFYSLGRPVDNKNHAPNMDVVNYFYNLFSYNDSIQRVFGAYEREVLPPHSRIANIRMVINDKHPTHSELHDKCVAQWIYTIHDLVCLNATFDFCAPSVLHFSDTNPPRLLFDTDRTVLQEEDRRVTNAIIHAFRVGKHALKEGQIVLKNHKLFKRLQKDK